MANEPTGPGDTSDQPPPPPLALDTAPPPFAAPPPPLAAARPAITPGKGPPAGLIVVGVFALLLAIGATLYFTGVFGGRPAAEPAKAEASATAPTAPAAGSGQSSSVEDLIAQDDTEPCQTIVSELEADDTPLASGQARNRAVVTANGDIMWNGQRIDRVRLRQYLDITATMVPPPVTSMVFEAGAPQPRINEVREVIFRSLGCRYPATAP